MKLPAIPNTPNNSATPDNASLPPAVSIVEIEAAIMRAVENANKEGDDTPLPEGAGILYDPNWQDCITDDLPEFSNR